MTNGHDYPADRIIGKCYYCKKLIKNRDKYYEGEPNGYVHIMCSKDPNSARIKRDMKKWPNMKK